MITYSNPLLAVDVLQYELDATNYETTIISP